MKKVFLALMLLVLTLVSCMNADKALEDHAKFLVNEIPGQLPMAFKPELTPSYKLVHRGIFLPDFEAYYYTISDKEFQQFDVKVIKKEAGKWSDPEEAFFNSEYSDHGMSFSADGHSLYFASTRPVGLDSIPNTWHIWRSQKLEGRWSEPQFVDIPNFRNKLLSHPTIANNGTLYFHASNLDYSAMHIYASKQKNGKFEDAEKVLLGTQSMNTCTPYISPDEDYLLFARVGSQLDLMISFNKQGRWTEPKMLNETINNHGQGNPSVTPDGKFMFFTTGTHTKEVEAPDWSVKWLNVETLPEEIRK